MTKVTDFSTKIKNVEGQAIGIGDVLNLLKASR